jgi:hypothetical protein
MASFAATQAQYMRTATEQMRTQVDEVRTAGDLLDACSNRFEKVESDVQQAKSKLEENYGAWRKAYDSAEVERQFAASYTTEMEREVMLAALNGAPLPVTQQAFAGNSVELF